MASTATPSSSALWRFVPCESSAEVIAGQPARPGGSCVLPRLKAITAETSGTRTVVGTSARETAITAQTVVEADLVGVRERNVRGGPAAGISSIHDFGEVLDDGTVLRTEGFALRPL